MSWVLTGLGLTIHVEQTSLKSTQGIGQPREGTSLASRAVPYGKNSSKVSFGPERRPRITYLATEGGYSQTILLMRKKGTMAP